MENKLSQATTERPELIAIIDDFKNELTRLSENTLIIRQKVSKLKDTEDALKSDLPEPCMTSNGFIFELQDCISELRNHNNSLNESINLFTRLLG